MPQSLEASKLSVIRAMICDLELLKLTDGANKSRHCGYYSHWKMSQSVQRLEFFGFTDDGFFCSECQRYTSECNCALSNCAFLPALVNSQHLCLLVAYCFLRQLYLTKKHVCTVEAPLCPNPKISCVNRVLVRFCISTVSSKPKNRKNQSLHFSAVIWTSWPDPPGLHKSNFCVFENIVHGSTTHSSFEVRKVQI